MKKYGIIFTAPKNIINLDRQRGVAIFMAVIMLVLILSLALGVNTLLISEIKTMRDAGNSVIAFYASESGQEWGLMQSLYLGNIDASNFASTPLLPYDSYLDINGDNNKDPNVDATFEVTAVAPGEGQCNATNFCLKTVGIYKGTRRVIETKL